MKRFRGALVSVALSVACSFIAAYGWDAPSSARHAVICMWGVLGFLVFFFMAFFQLMFAKIGDRDGKQAG